MLKRIIAILLCCSTAHAGPFALALRTIPAEPEQPAAATPIPVVRVYCMPPADGKCPACIRFKGNAGLFELAFEFIDDPARIPDWVVSYPTAHWQTPAGDWRQHVGYENATAFRAAFHASVGLPAPPVAEKPAEKPPEPAKPKTATCRCGGSNHGVCYCLQRGVQCKCSPSVGSVWNLDDNNRPVNKTGAYANPGLTGQVTPLGNYGTAPRKRKCKNGVCWR